MLIMKSYKNQAQKLKILIIGIDALEYELVKKYNLKALKQLKYFKIKVPINKELKMPTTPTVWASFLTGKIINCRFEYENKLLKAIDFMFRIRKKLINRSFGLGSLIISIFRKFNKPAIKTFPKLKGKTFLEKTNSDYCNIPFYDYSDEYKKIIVLLNKTFSKREITRQELKKELLNIFENDKEKIIKKVKDSKAELFFCYFHFLDLIQHCFFDKEGFIKDCYKDVENFVKELKKMSKAELVVIISDHGQEQGTHTNYGFCSINKKLKFPREITGFYDFFIKQIKKQTS